MGRRLRYIPPGGCVVEVTNRTIQGRYLLKPSRELNSLVVGILGRAQRLYHVEIHACVVLSNHYHMLLSVESAIQLARFMAYFQGNLAKEAGRLHKWRGPFWQRRYQHILVSDEEVAQVGRLRYVLENSCKEGLVSSPVEWPGVSSAQASMGRGELRGYWIDRTREQRERSRSEHADRPRFREVENVVLTPVPCWKGLTIMLWRERVRVMVAEIETETAKHHESEGTRPMGSRAVLGKDPHERPASFVWSPAPMFHCASREARNVLKEAYSSFAGAFARAAERWRAGSRQAGFPVGAFLPPVPVDDLSSAVG